MIHHRMGAAVSFEIDEHPRPESTPGSLASLKPAFKTESGSVTAGNASGLNDGAAAVVVASLERARLMELVPMATIVSYSSAGVDPHYMGMGPVPAIERALDKADLRLNDIDLFELNEAFAAQSLAVMKQLGLDSLCIGGGQGIALIVER